MSLDFRLQQDKHQVVDVTNWEFDEEFPYFPQGNKPKRFLICPTPSPAPFLISGHRYIFKTPPDRRQQQIWSEVIAYEIGRMLQVPVPPAFIASAKNGQELGVLIEFFYGYQLQEPQPRLVHAIDVLEGMGRVVDLRVGSLKQNIEACRLMKVVRWREWWLETLIFDALIGNTDRHSENWGFLLFPGSKIGLGSPRLAPAFDNGTSLGWQTPEEKLVEKCGEVHRFIEDGRHHYAWQNGLKGDQHIALVKHFVQNSDASSQACESMIQFTDHQIDEIVRWASGFDVGLLFSEQRADFVKAQVVSRRDALKAALGEIL